MEVPRSGPILTFYETHRLIAAGLVSDKVHVAQFAEQSRWVGDAKYVQETPKGLLCIPVTADFFVFESCDASVRRIEASIRSLDQTNPFSVRFGVEERRDGISYLLRESKSPGRNQVFTPPIKVHYSFRSPLEIPHQVTPEDLVSIDDNHALLLNQEMVAGILRTGRLPLLAPQPK